jgi:pimeloyl-ACP methyl ester carboxylesterase
VVFLHGLGTTARMWNDQLRALPEFQCLAPDLPGHGSATARPWVSLAATAAEIAALIEATPHKRAHVVGLSLGGAVAIELMSTRPELLDRVIVDGTSAVSWRLGRLLSAGVAIFSPFVHTRPVMRFLAWALSVKTDRHNGFYDDLRLVSGRTLRRSVHDALAVRLRNADRVGGPVLLVAGQHDVAAARASNATLARQLPDASAWYAPRRWHAWVGTDPNLHRAMVRAFLLGQPLPPQLAPETTRPRRSEATG